MNAERARRRRVAPLQVVDHEHERRVSREVRGEPVQAVLPRVAGIAGRCPDRPRASRSAAGAVSTSAASAAAPANQRSRSPLSASSSRALEQLAHDPERESLFELRRPRAQDATPSSDARCACLLEQSRLAHPRGALDDQDAPGSLSHGAQHDIATRSTSCSRSSSAAGRASGGLVHAPHRSYAPQRVGRKCSGIDVRGCARCARRRPSGRWPPGNPPRRTA